MLGTKRGGRIRTHQSLKIPLRGKSANVGCAWQERRGVVVSKGSPGRGCQKGGEGTGGWKGKSGVQP